MVHHLAVTEEIAMKKENRRPASPKKTSPAAEPALAKGDADERRSRAWLSKPDENAFVEEMDVDDDYSRGVDALTRRLGWSAFQ
jgi:hypothetical protein